MDGGADHKDSRVPPAPTSVSEVWEEGDGHSDFKTPRGSGLVLTRPNLAPSQWILEAQAGGSGGWAQTQLLALLPSGDCLGKVCHWPSSRVAWGGGGL